MSDDAESADSLMLENAALRALMHELLYQLSLAAGDDVMYFWKIGGRPMDDAYKAARRAMETIEGRDG